jgi:hypothetical protein
VHDERVAGEARRQLRGHRREPGRLRL